MIRRSGALALALPLVAALACESVTNPTDSSRSGLVPATHQSGTVVVHPADMQGWGFAQETPNGSGQMVAGPETPPLGTGSANLIVDNTGGWILGYAHYEGTPLADIDRLEYSTYRTTGSSALAIALQFNIDFDLTDAITVFQGRLVYEPYYTHTVVTGEWQTWNTLDDAGTGNWWFTRPPGNLTCSIANPCTWSEVLAAFPNAGIHPSPGLGAVLLKAGGGWIGGFDGNTDALTIGISGVTVTYDYELHAPQPTSTEQCKNGGYATYGFRNVGQCNRFVNTGQDSR